MSKTAAVLALSLMLLAFPAFADEATLQVEDVMGANPKLVDPVKSTFPTVKIAEVKRWEAGKTPLAAPGFTVKEFAGGLDHPRWIYVLPNGDVLVAETNAPPKPEQGGIKGFFMKKAMKKAGAATKSANRITLLRDADGDGRPEVREAFLENLNSPFGMALVGNDFYVADTDKVMKFPYTAGATKITAPSEKLADLPGGDLNHHWTKNLVASKDGKFLYASVGSNSNVAENGLDKEVNRAAILEIERATGKTRLFASGLRNPVGMDFNPVTGDLWTAVNERDELGSDLVPDYMTSVKDGAFYGWPWSYWGHVDTRVEPTNVEMVAKALSPDYALGPHTASLGLTFYTADAFGAAYKNGVFIGQHGSWNRDPPSGYKVIFVPFKNGKPDGKPENFLSGFLDAEGNAQGRPVGVAVDSKGALLVADDVGNVIWRVSAP
ncbi:MAG: sorbosone dehydrogenase family protein [Alphaproteobacteria bacterium]